jgi:nucleotide-binding universal stress UspA family protein
MFEKILLAVDGSDHALHAARTAAALARFVNASEFHIIVAYDFVPAYLGEINIEYAINARMSEAKGILQVAVGEVGALPCEVQTELIEGSAAQAIIEAAETHKCDIIVMGSRGLGTLAGLVLGSTSQKVVAHAPCPVLIVR